MLFLLLAIPLGLLCLYLAFLACRRRYRRQALFLLAIGGLFLGAVFVTAAFTWYGWHRVEVHSGSQFNPKKGDN